VASGHLIAELVDQLLLLGGQVFTGAQLAEKRLGFGPLAILDRFLSGPKLLHGLLPTGPVCGVTGSVFVKAFLVRGAELLPALFGQIEEAGGFFVFALAV
jgi:hypothetical protein